MSPRLPVVACVVATAIFTGLVGCRRTPPPPVTTQKLVILGFDGLDPRLVRQYVAAGRLPHMATLIGRGGLYELDTTHSPESPTAWASFATGVNPGKHNIYDFLVRDTATYLPDLGMVRRIPPTFLFDFVPTSRPRVESLRGGTSFWVTAGQAGIRSTVLTVPVTFPPEDVPNGELLAGLPLPDIRGTMGTFYYFATDLSRYEEGSTEFGGILKRLVFDNDEATTTLVGPPNPIVRQQITTLRARSPLSEADVAALDALRERADVTLPLTVRWQRGASTATVTVGGEQIPLERGVWSAWVPLEFRVNALIRIQGMAQMLLLSADDDLRLYVSPINWRPDAPPLPMSSPASLAGEIAATHGLYRTLGWAEATWPLEEGRIDERTFLDDVHRAFDDRARVILGRLDQRNWDLFIGVIEAPDRVQHLMWRLVDREHPMYDATLAAAYGDSIERIYERCDRFVGEVLARLDPSVPVLIVSDHGFHSWRTAVNLNTWLVQEGYMTLRGDTGFKTLNDLFGGGQFWEHVDWTKTRAYAMGLGQIYFNLRGREAQGIVSPGAEALALADDLASRLRTFVDPATGLPIVQAVYKRDAVYSGPYLENAADLQVGFRDGYRVSWQTALGGAPASLLYPNTKKWSGDHGSFDRADTAGVLISSRPLERDRYDIMDVAPTVLKHFGVDLPRDLDGAPMF